MNPEELTQTASAVWMYAAGPAVAIAAIVLTVRLRLPQVLGLPAAFRALREEDPGAPGQVHPATSVALSAVATYGAAAAVGAATAIALGGPGAIPWVWLFSFLLAPLRVAEAVLSRTAPAGKAGTETGSLAGRLLAEDAGWLQGLGWALVVLVPLTAFAFFGGTHGTAVLGAAEQLLPGSAFALGIGVAVVAGLLALAPVERAGSILGWIATVSLIALFGAALVTLFGDLGRGMGGIGRALQDVFYDMPQAGAFSGALAGEIAISAILYLLPPAAAVGGVDGAIHADARAPTTRNQAAAALLGALAYGLLTTVLGLSLVATNAFATPVEGSRSIRDVTFYRAGFETVSQRNEQTRRQDGPIRIQEGETGVVEIHVGIERGMVLAPRFEMNGEPANVLLRLDDGEVIEILQPGAMGALQTAPDTIYDELQVTGRMLPTDGRLLAESFTQGGGAITSRVALAALLLLAALGAVGWGWGVRKTLAARVPAQVARFAAVIPALGLAIAAAGLIPRFDLWGAIAAGLLTIVTSIVLLVLAGPATRVLAGAKKAAPAPAPGKSGGDDAKKKKRKKRKKA